MIGAVLTGREDADRIVRLVWTKIAMVSHAPSPAKGILIIFGGLPGTGKTTIARQLSKRLSAAYLRIDSLEQGLVNAGLCAMGEIQGAGYEAAYALAKDNLCLGMTVVADSVNPLEITRAAWRRTAIDAGTSYMEVEVVCSDVVEHRRRVENRVADIAGLVLPDWRRVAEREYEPWNTSPLSLDTAVLTPEQAVALILERRWAASGRTGKS